MAETQGQLVLAQNQHAFIQDATKGTVQVYAGPHSLALSGNDRPVTYEKSRDEFVATTLANATKQNPLVPEGHYLVLENPVTDKDNKLSTPRQGSNSPVQLEVGRKINIPGPATFPLWPGQFAEVIPGHHLRSNQYLVARVYNADQANQNAPEFLQEKILDANGKPTAAAKPLTPGQQIVIKGTGTPFFIPPTGFEVLEENGNYVREALTLERLEYAILLDEDGNKRYEKGPQVVFPEATERFVVKKEQGSGNGDRKFKAIELNDQMGLYIKVIAEYKEEDGIQRNVGDEIFITGKQQRIYYPRPEHALIEYDDPTKNYKRQRYYGITIPKGEGRYVLDKVAGDIKTEKGSQIFLPDPRHQVIVRRVIDPKTVALWYPGNQEALAFNESLRSLTQGSGSYLADSVVLSAAADVSRGLNRGTQYSKGLVGGSFEGDTLRRGTKFTPPPMLTLDTKYDGVPSIDVWTGYAVQVVNKAGERRVVVGPNTILLEYDESLDILELSTGKPKSTDLLKRDVYLRVDNNLVSDIVHVETKDLVNVKIRTSYRVNFLRENKDKWFSVENYVKYLTDHMRSLLKAAAKAYTIKEFIEGSATIVRDVVLGTKVDGEKRGRLFEENGMFIYDVEVLGTDIADEKIATLVRNAQQNAVQSAITLASEEQGLENTRRKVKIQAEVTELETSLAVRRYELQQEAEKAAANAVMAKLQSDITEQVARLTAEVEQQKAHESIAASELGRQKAIDEQELAAEAQRVTFFEKKMAAISEDLVAAMTTLGETEFATKLATAIAPLAIHEQSGISTMFERVFRDTPIANVLSNVQGKSASAK